MSDNKKGRENEKPDKEKKAESLRYEDQPEQVQRQLEAFCAQADLPHPAFCS